MWWKWSVQLPVLCGQAWVFMALRDWDLDLQVITSKSWRGHMVKVLLTAYWDCISIVIRRIRLFMRGVTVGTDSWSGKEDVTGFKLRLFYWVLLYYWGSGGSDPAKSLYKLSTADRNQCFTTSLPQLRFLHLICTKEKMVVQQHCISSQAYICL